MIYLFRQKKEPHDELGRFTAEDFIEYNESSINKLNQYLIEKWDHAIPLPAYFHG